MRRIGVIGCTGWAVLLASTPLVVIAIRLLWPVGSRPHVQRAQLFLLSALVTVVFGGGVLRRFSWLHVFVHELAHTVVSLALGGRILEFVATADAGGHVVHSSRYRLPVAIAPYTVPFLALSVVGFTLLRGDGPSPAIAACLGAAAGVHVLRTIEDTRLNLRAARGGAATDFDHYGPTITCVWVVAVNLWELTSIAAYASRGGSGIVVLWLQTGRLVHEWWALALTRAQQLAATVT